MDRSIIGLIECQSFIVEGMINPDRLLQNLFSVLKDREVARIFLYMFFWTLKVIISDFKIITSDRKWNGLRKVSIFPSQINLIYRLPF